MPGFPQGAGETRSVGSGALDAEGPHRTEGARPGLDPAVSLAVDRGGHGAEASTERVQRHRGVGALVRVDPDDDLVGWRSLLQGELPLSG